MSGSSARNISGSQINMPSQKQHYVPQFYLRYFARRQKKHYLLWCYDKAEGKSFQSNPKNLAQETGYYEFSVNEGEKQSLEQFLSAAESKFKNALDKVCSTPSLKVLEDNIDALSLFIACQMIRTPILHAEILDATNGANEKLAKFGTQLPVPSENELKEIQAGIILEQTPLFAKVLREMKWVLIHNRASKPIWTSDNPISEYNPLLEGSMGLKSKGIGVDFPLSPMLALIICDPKLYAAIPSEMEASPPNIEFLNSGQVVSSRRYVFSTSNDFELAQDMIAKNPYLADPNRLRVITS